MTGKSSKTGTGKTSAGTAALIRRLTAPDAGRLPALLARKYSRMAGDAFAFYRGSNHLFQAAVPRGLLRGSPAVWLNGDLHLENFGSYRGENRLTYFDIGDFDDGGLGAASRDLMRFVSALHLAGPELDLGAARARQLTRLYLNAYRDALAIGKALWLERRLAVGLIGGLMQKLDARLKAGPEGSAWLQSRVAGKGDKRHWRLDTGKAMAAPPAFRKSVAAAIREIGRQQQRLGRGTWRILDIAWRIAGLGTLGLPRFLVLVEVTAHRPGDQILTTEGDLLLLDIKVQPGSLLAPVLEPQPDFAGEADRVVAIETRLQAISPALLMPLRIDGRSYTLRELQPEADKLDLKQIRGESGRLDLADLQQAIDMMGRLTAWAQLRSAGRQGSATADQLMAFSARDTWVDPLLAAGDRLAADHVTLWRHSRAWLLDEAERLTDAHGS